jgi:hypothetical protein
MGARDLNGNPQTTPLLLDCWTAAAADLGKMDGPDNIMKWPLRINAKGLFTRVRFQVRFYVRTVDATADTKLQSQKITQLQSQKKIAMQIAYEIACVNGP